MDQTTLFMVAGVLLVVVVGAVGVAAINRQRHSRTLPQQPVPSGSSGPARQFAKSKTTSPTPLPPVLPGYSVMSTNGTISDVSPALTIYQLIAIKHNRPAALKIINLSKLAQKADRWEKLQPRLTAAQSLRHPNCAEVWGSNITAPVPYFIEEWLGGGSLEDCLRTNGPMAGAELTTIIGQVCDGLAYLHAHDIVYSVLTPAHIRFDEQGTANIIHCGFARLVNDVKPIATGDLPNITRNDFYALGLIAFQMATGKFPFESNEAVAIQQGRLPMPNPQSFNAALSNTHAQAIEKALNLDPAQRFQNAQEMARAFGYEEPFR